MFILSLLFSSDNKLSAQGFSQRESLLKNAHGFVYNRPDEAIKIGKHLLKNSASIDDEIVYSLIVAKGYFVKGNYNDALFYAFQTRKNINKMSFVSKELIHLKFLKYNILKTLKLNSQADDHYVDAENLIETFDDSKEKFLLHCELLLNKACVNYRIGNYKQSQKVLIEIDSLYRKTILEDDWLRQRYNTVLGAVKSELGELETAKMLLDSSYRDLENMPVPNYLVRSALLSHMGRWHFLNKNHPEAITVLLSAIESAKKIDNVPLLHEIHRQLLANYLAINDKENYKRFNTEILVLDNRLDLLEQESVNTAFNLISKGQENYFNAQKSKYSHNFYIALCMSLIFIGALSFFYFRERWKKNRLKEIIRYLEISRNVYNKPKTDKTVAKDKRLTIPKETEQNILAKLKRFEQSKKFTSKDMSLAVLAGQFETNTKYLSEIINTHYQDNFNTYINKLRIDYIIEKLKTNPNYMHYKISYLAEKGGFSSHSSFATVFKSIAGITPVTFIELLKQEKNVKQENEI